MKKADRFGRVNNNLFFLFHSENHTTYDNKRFGSGSGLRLNTINSAATATTGLYFGTLTDIQVK